MLSLRRVRSLDRPHDVARTASRALLRGGLLCAAAGALALPLLSTVGCSDPEKSDIVVAEVGDRTITLDYFERKMNTMDPEYIPPDIQSRSGREQLLDVMINKEVMALKAEELGMAADGGADEQAEQVATLKAVTRMREEILAPHQEPTEEQILDYYEKLPRKLTVSYMLFDHYDDAMEAKGLVEGGELWRDVAERFDAGDPGPNGNYTLAMQYGTVADDLEEKVFDLPLGGVSEPIDSIYGWFVIRVDDVTLERVQPLETIRDRVVASVVKQESALAIKRFIEEEVFPAYQFMIDEEVLELVFDALPEDPPLQPAPDPEDLESLDVAPADLDRVLMKYADEVWTVRRFSDFYDGTSVYGRPRREQRLGNLRRYLKEQAIRDLMPMAARDRGYMDDPLVQDEFKMRREQAMVTKLHSELIAGEVEVTPAEVEAYWEENKEEYYKPERREVLAVVTETEADAISAQLEAQSGTDWDEIVEQYCIESDVKQRGGAMPPMPLDPNNALSRQAFDLAAEGDISMPVEIGEDQWLVVKLVRVFPEERPTLADVRPQVGRRVQGLKEEELFQQKVQQWREEYEIETHPEHLMKAVYDPAPPSQSIPVRVGGGV